MSTIAVHLLGSIDFDACLALQQRLVYECSGSSERQITLLVCEHPTLISVGRQGSRGDLHIPAIELEHRGIAVRWVNRGGPAVVHLPGQLAVYPIVPIERLGWSVGAYLDRLEGGLAAALDEAGFRNERLATHRGIFCRSGQVGVVGVSVKNGVSYYGAYLNAAPAMELVRRVTSDLRGRWPLSSLLVEQPRMVKMAGIRERVARRLAAAFDAEHCHYFTGHPFLFTPRRAGAASAAKVG